MVIPLVLWCSCGYQLQVIHMLIHDLVQSVFPKVLELLEFKIIQKVIS